MASPCGHIDATMAARVAEPVRHAVAELVFIEEDRPIRITVSAGVATYRSTRGVDSVDELVRCR